GRLVGYRWPEQPDSDGLDEVADDDGSVCLPPVGGEQPAANRLQALLARAYGDRWSPGLLRQLLEQTGSKKKNLDDWLRDDFFSHHCSVFSHRPFVWHIWDGRKDGFAALVNYHRLDRAGLEKLTYTYLGDWIERQRADAADDVAGADLRLAAAQELKGKLEAILKGEPPYDIYVRWKALHEQPIGWEPDLDDGVRLNIRPFVMAGVLRSRVNVHWKKDRGRNPDGSERHNDVHCSIAEKQQARREAAGA
ncbi:MAG: SAM-dependent DNA methyltransferase, partial [Gemmatimonadota bacterium]|nr:SAM-dependent DNA methyltransferase [Gemmatimonadota bacterium]